jgi:pyruvate dehydrogenase E2 component (dihydrolipoamide acetyltransferase)
MPEITLPSLGAEMEEGTVLEWYIKPGDQVEYGDIVALLDTEKAEIEMEAFETGTVESLLVERGQTVAVGTPMVRLGATRSDAAAPPRPIPTAESVPSTPSPPSPTAAKRSRATPLARRIARERGIDLASLSGSGPGGAILEADIPTSAAGSAAHETRDESHRVARRREIIAAAMSRSKREIPHYYLSTPIQIDNTLNWLANHNAGRDINNRLLLPALLIKAVAKSAQEFPELNGHWRENGFHPEESVHVGMVVSLRTGGLVVPTIHSADERSVSDVMRELRDVVGRARAGRLRSGELRDATITLTSLGDQGSEMIFGVIYPPQVAIVGFGGVYPGLCAEGDLHGTRPVIRASLAADHRASDGQRGSRFLESIARALRDPEQL